MTALLDKLNLGKHDSMLVLNSPEFFDEELSKLETVKVVRKVKAGQVVEFAIGFAISQAELDRVSSAVAKATEGDAVVWMAYPKGSSKKYKCEFNRDTGWTVLGKAGFEPVRQVSIDDDWSALRFRRVEFIKSFTRTSTNAISSAGKKRSAKEKTE